MVHFLAGAGNFSLLQSVQIGAGTHPHAYSVYRHFTQEQSVQVLRLTAHPPSNAEVKNWGNFSLP
jgi:hypothetical protein